eukprot:gnl/TRDRNA2_/TRDRNA2_203486_c0_seq1.p1 gnl/TRDRNA2_/TRDRNA2_203486_c0~~gnl/TRDRNA2_/TRDRNA2_203486_c0_seq1.p1  ORF type:complete len:338 (+),score=50.03 gnl/TRDRNA2_/TRDRNA2_203486_c0_seq1:83-1096(+)
MPMGCCGEGAAKSSLHICSISGVPVHMHYLLPAATMLSVAGIMASGHPSPMAIVLALLVSGPLLFLTVLAHELGHVFAARRCGCIAEHILLWPLGGIAVIGAGAVGPKEQIFISGSGPATHLPMLLLWALLMAIVNGGHVGLSTAGMTIEQNFLAVVAVCMLCNNLAMLIFNLMVPCFPLDCSQIVISGMLLRGYDNSTIAKTVVVLSVPVVAFLALYGLWAYFSGNPAATVNIFMAGWLISETWKLHSARVRGELNSHPLFARPPPAVATAAATAAPSPAMQPQPFTGKAQQLGKPENSGMAPPPQMGDAQQQAQVCLGSLISIAVVMTVVLQTPE